MTRSRETQGPQATPRPETPQSPAPAQSRLEPLAVPSATETPAIRTAVAEARPQPTSVSPVEATPGAQVGPPSFSQKLMEAPSVSSVSPRSIRRGSTAVLELRGERLRPDMGVRILQGRRPAVGIRVVRVEFVSPVLLRITVLSEAELPLGGYTLLLQDPTGASVPGVQIEVVL